MCSPVERKKREWLDKHAGDDFNNATDGSLELKTIEELKYIRTMYQEKIDLAHQELSTDNAIRNVLVSMIAVVISLLSLAYSLSSVNDDVTLGRLAALIIFMLVFFIILTCYIAVSNIGIGRAANSLEERMLECDEEIIFKIASKSAEDKPSTSAAI